MQPSFSSMSGTWSDSFMPGKDKPSTSTLTSSMPAKDQDFTSVKANDQISTSIPAKDQIANPSVPPKDLTASSSMRAKHQTSTSVLVKDQIKSSSTPGKDIGFSNRNQFYSFSIPASGKDEKTYSKSETSASSSEMTELASSTIPMVVTYSFTTPPSSASSLGSSAKNEPSLSVVVSSFTVPSIIYSFSLRSSDTETATSKPSLGPLPIRSEKSSSTTGLEQLPGGKDSSSKVDRPRYNATSSVIPLWTPDMLGNAYGGGFVNTPSIYVTLAPNPIVTATGVPPGYGFLIKTEAPRIPNQSSSPFSNSIGTSNDKKDSGGSPTQGFPLSSISSSYTTDEYGIPTSSTSSKTGSTDCCSALTTLSVGEIDNSGLPVSVSESSPTTYTFGDILPTPIIKAPYGNNASLSAGNGSGISNGALMNPTVLPEYRGFAVKNTMGLTAGLFGILVFVFLI